MENENNRTYIAFQGHVELNTFGYLYFLIMLTVYILIICFNVTIVCLICFHKNLHEPMYVFIAALLINSVIFSTIIYPKLLTDFLSERQIISYSACLFQFFMYYTLSASEFFLLSAMAYDRYVSISKPLQYLIIMKKTRVSVLLVLTWTIPACHVAVPVMLIAETKLCNFTIKGIFCNNSIYELQCVQSRVIAIYGVVPLIDLIIFPLLFIIFTYTKILIIAYRSCGEVRKKASETCFSHLLVIISVLCLSVYDISVGRVETNLSPTARLIMTLQKVSYHPLFNPVVYGLKMKEISKHLKRLFCLDTLTKNRY